MILEYQFRYHGKDSLNYHEENNNRSLRWFLFDYWNFSTRGATTRTTFANLFSFNRLLSGCNAKKRRIFVTFCEK